MANELIGRIHNIGLGKETTAGTAVSATDWLPKVSGAFQPRFEVARDPGSNGVIDAVKEAHTTRTWTEVELEGVIRDTFFGHLLMAAFGNAEPCVKFPVSGGSGTFTIGETVTESTSSATGTLIRDDSGGSTKLLFIKPATGTFTGGQTLTGGSSGATFTGGTIESPSAVRSHVFRKANTNTHQSYTLYGKDTVGDERAAYCLLDSLEMDFVVGEYASFTAKYIGKQAASTSSTASYSAQNPFLAKFATFKHATAQNSLDAASATAITRLKLVIEKNVEAYYAFGSTSPSSIHNRPFLIRGDMDLLYNESTTRDYLTNTTKRAMRLSVANTGVTIGSAANPTLQLDFPSVAFEEWERTPENDELVRQTVGFVMEFDLTRTVAGEAILQNSRTTTY